MKIYLTAEELNLAIKEYVTSRGIDASHYIGTEFKVGRKENSTTTACVNLGTAPVSVQPAPAPKIYENVTKKIKATEEVIEQYDSVQDSEVDDSVLDDFLDESEEEPETTATVTSIKKPSLFR